MSLLTCWHWSYIGLTVKFQQFKYCFWPNIGRTPAYQGDIVTGHKRPNRDMFADCLTFIFLSIVRFSLILQIRRWELFSENGTHGWVAKSNQMNVSESVILWNQFIFPKPVSIKHASHTNQRNTRTTCRVGKLFIWMKHFRNNPLINESFPGENHFLVFCIQRIRESSYYYLLYL